MLHGQFGSGWDKVRIGLVCLGYNGIGLGMF